MKLFRLAFSLGGAALLAGALSGCLKEPEYSTTPEISFNSITNTRIPPKITGGVVQDSMTVTINYQDGDGDLGLSSAERQNNAGPYAQTINNQPNKFYFNYFIEPYVKQVGSRSYVLASSIGRTTAGAYNSAFPHITSLTDSKAAPIKGTLKLGIAPFILGLTFFPGEKVKYGVSIADRALHVSNTIMTDSVVIGPR